VGGSGGALPENILWIPARVRYQTRLTASSVTVAVVTVKWSNEKQVARLPDNDDVGVFVGGIVFLFQGVERGGSAFPAILKLSHQRNDRLGAWLLSIIQRYPRYLLLLKIFISFDRPEHAPRAAVHTLVSKSTPGIALDSNS